MARAFDIDLTIDDFQTVCEARVTSAVLVLYFVGHVMRGVVCVVCQLMPCHVVSCPLMPCLWERSGFRCVDEG